MAHGDSSRFPNTTPRRFGGRRSRTVGLALMALGAVCGFAVVGCGSDDAAKVTTTVPTGGGGTEVSPVLEEIEARGKPTLGATDEVQELVVTDDVEGTGAEVKPGDTVTAHYVGVQASNGVEFDSSWSRGEPTQFPLDQVIEGWGTGLVGMKEGGRRTLVIPAAQAYGDRPPPGAGIAPGATLVFTVDLVSVD